MTPRVFEAVQNLADCNPLWPDRDDVDYFVYRLGPPMKPNVPVATGKIFTGAGDGDRVVGLSNTNRHFCDFNHTSCVTLLTLDRASFS